MTSLNVAQSVHALGSLAMLNDCRSGVKREIHMLCTCSAARGMSARQGLGEHRRVDVRFLMVTTTSTGKSFEGVQCPVKWGSVWLIHYVFVPC